MKKLCLSVLLGLSILFSGNLCFAAGGSAVVSQWISSETCNTQINMSNITDATIDVKITFYDQSGNVIKDASPYAGIFTGTNCATYDDNPTSAHSIILTIAANSSAKIAVNMLGSTVYLWGYGIVEWSQSSQTPCGLVANSRILVSNYGMFHTPVNGGKPF